MAKRRHPFRAAKLRRRHKAKPGEAPGTIRIDPEAARPVVHAMCYGADDLVERQVEDLESIPGMLGQGSVCWVDVQGLGDEGTLLRLMEIFDLHRLALEDVVNLNQRAKVEPYEDHLFIVAHAPVAGTCETEQVSLFLGRGFVLTFQERPGDSFDGVRHRLRTSKGMIRRAGADYLTYALLDSVVDGYFPILDRLSEELEAIEVAVLGDDGQEDAISRIHRVKSDLISMRRAIWPHREALSSLIRDGGELIQPETAVYLRDCYDHTVRIVELVESYREISSDLMSTYLSVVSNRLNDVMKVLTIIATLFIPLSFIAGVYGMNFDTKVSPWNMPELGWAWGYPFALGVMLVVAVGLVLFFVKRGWLR